MDNFLKQCRSLQISVRETDFDEYLRDESRFTGHASALIRARDVQEVVHVLKLAHQMNVQVTVVSGKTSVTGGPVPLGGVILDVIALNGIDEDDPRNVGPGVILKDYKQRVEEKGLYYPPDPTSEDSCTLGGNVSSNASGASSYLYGPTREYIDGLSVVLPTGTLLTVNRGDVVSRGGALRVPGGLLEPGQDEDLIIPVPRTRVPPWHVCKNSAGLFSQDPMDLVDLFVGSEGILGVIVKIRTVLLTGKKSRFSLMLYVPSLDFTVDLIGLLDRFTRFFHASESHLKDDIDESLKRFTGRPIDGWQERFSSVTPCCVEWFGSSCARFLSSVRARKLNDAYGALYLEQEFSAGENPADVAAQWGDLVEMLNQGLPEQTPSIDSEVALDEKHLRGLKEERHRVPEKLNESIKPGMVKIATDFSVPKHLLGDLLSLYDSRLPKDKSYVFGHIGNAHVHANLVPDDSDEAGQFRALYMDLAKEVCRLGGSVAGEHGIGKLKREALEMMIGSDGIEEIRRVKRTLDPKGILNPQNMVVI
jgi:D-lactate dehydrogenase (cytochrome)